MSAQSATMEDILLTAVPGTGDTTDAPNDTTCLQVITCCGHDHTVPSCAKDRDYRRLAISSIICGLSCIGILALVNSVKAREARKTTPEKAKQYSQRAKTFGIISIVVWVVILVLSPLLLVLVSYLLTLID